MTTKPNTSAPTAPITLRESEPLGTETDARILALDGAPSPARLTRILAGSAFRTAQWSRNQSRWLAQAAGFIMRVSARQNYGEPARVTLCDALIHTDSTQFAPRRLIDAAAALDANNINGTAHDAALDLTTGYLLLRGAQSGAFCGARSAHGFGVTFPSLTRGSGADGISAQRLAAAYAEDTMNMGSPMGSASADSAAFNLSQRGLRKRALVALARQWCAEGADAQMHPLDRARRVRAAAVACPDAHRWEWGTDCLAPELQDYALSAAQDTDGSLAFARFARAEDTEKEQQEASDTACSGRERRDIETANLREDGQRATDQNGMEQRGARERAGDKCPSAWARETEGEAAERMSLATAQRKAREAAAKLPAAQRAAALDACERTETANAAERVEASGMLTTGGRGKPTESLLYKCSTVDITL